MADKVAWRRHARLRYHAGEISFEQLQAMIREAASDTEEQVSSMSILDGDPQ